MNQSTYRISLDIHSVASQLSFGVNRGDNMRRLIITLTENGKTYEITKDCYAIFTTVKPDGNTIANDCTIQNNTIIYDFTEQTTAVAGTLDCSIIVYTSRNERITSPRFTVIVYETTHQDINLASESEYTILINQVAESTQCIEEMTNLIEAVNNERETGVYDGLGVNSIQIGLRQSDENGNLYQLDFYMSDGTIKQTSLLAPRGERGIGIPEGGTAGQIIVKTEDGMVWQDAKGSYTYSPYSTSSYGIQCLFVFPKSLGISEATLVSAIVGFSNDEYGYDQLYINTLEESVNFCENGVWKDLVTVNVRSRDSYYSDWVTYSAVFSKIETNDTIKYSTTEYYFGSPSKVDFIVK